MHFAPKILVVCSKNSGRIASFIEEQVESLRSIGIKCAYYTIEGKGIKGYMKSRGGLMRKIKDFRPDLIHAHYGLSGLLANTQRQVPVITTYHGSDINDPKVRPLSKICVWLSARNIFVSEQHLLQMIRSVVGTECRNTVIPCGVNTDLFVPADKEESRRQLGLESDKKYVLFAGAFHNPVKNPELARAAVKQLSGVTLLELKGYSREQVALLMNAVDALLMTSHTEGSPQVVKEAMACNCPVVSVPVGDVPEILTNVGGCFVTTREAFELSEVLQHVLSESSRTRGREVVLSRGLDLNSVAERLIKLYDSLLGLIHNL